MKKINIEYHGKMVEALIVGDYKATISPEDAIDASTVVMFVAQEEKSIECVELEQCLNCGAWCSEDDELYGDGYCTDCAEMCDDCQLYFSPKDIIRVNKTWYSCKKCAEKKNDE